MIIKTVFKLLLLIGTKRIKGFHKTKTCKTFQLQLPIKIEAYRCCVLL